MIYSSRAYSIKTRDEKKNNQDVEKNERYISLELKDIEIIMNFERES